MPELSESLADENVLESARESMRRHAWREAFERWNAAAATAELGPVEWDGLAESAWWIGGLLGLLHAAVALTLLVPLLAGVHPRMASNRAGPASTALLEPPGLFALNYGIQTPVVTTVAHLVYGGLLGVLLQAS